MAVPKGMSTWWIIVLIQRYKNFELIYGDGHCMELVACLTTSKKEIDVS
jgi:hypothetical protein